MFWLGLIQAWKLELLEANHDLGHQEFTAMAA